MKRAWLLIRVPSIGSDVLGVISQQSSMLQKYCDLNDYTIVKTTTVFGAVDKVKASIEEDLSGAQADVLVAVDTNRVARRMEDLASIRDLLKLYDIDMDFVKGKGDYLHLDETMRTMDQLGRIFASLEEESAEIKHPDSDMADRYYDGVLSILNEIDFVELDDSCNNGDPEYAVDVLSQLHDLFIEFYGSNEIQMYDYEYIMVPAVIRGIETGHVGLALLTLDLTSSGEHCNTVFLTAEGIADDQCSDYSVKEKSIERCYMPYQYWYTPMIAGDIHFDRDSIPEDLFVFFEPVFAKENTDDTYD